jgi:hypothetical protein
VLIKQDYTKGKKFYAPPPWRLPQADASAYSEQTKLNQNSAALASEPYRQIDRPLSAKLVSTFFARQSPTTVLSVF